MKKVLRVYAVLTSISICAIMLVVGVLIAETNTRKLSFGEEAEVVQIYNTKDQKVGISSGERKFEIPSSTLNKAKEIVIKIEYATSPILNNISWLKENIEELIKN